MTTHVKTSPCLCAALEYLEQDFSIIPINGNGNKKPLVAWTELQKRRASEEEVEGWFQKWPDANIAIVTGSISGIFVIDGDGEIGSRWIAENCPPTSIYVQTGRDYGCHAYYRIPPGVTIKSQNGFRPKVDLKADGGYVIVPPSRHISGRVYEFVFRAGLEGWRDLTVFNPLEMKRGAMLNLDLSGVKATAEESSIKPTVQGQRNQALAEAVGRLVAKGLGYQEVLVLAKGLNQQNRPPMGEAEVVTTVKSIFKTHISNHPSLDAETVISGAEEPKDGAKIMPFISGTRSDAAPTEMLQPGGLIQEIMDYFDQASAASVPLFNLGAAICLVGAVAGQRVMTETGLRTNIYAISLGYSGSGKDAPLSGMQQILMRTKARCLQGPSELTSAAAMMKHLACKDCHRVLYAVDEIGMVMRGLKNPASPLAEIPRVLTKLFSGTNRSEKKTYADEKLNFIIPWHHLSLYGASTPEEFWASLGEGDTVNGFLARLLVLESRLPAPEPKTWTNPEPTKSIIQKVNDIWAIEPKTADDAGNLEVASGSARPIPHKIEKSPAAQTLFSPFAKRYHDLKNDHRTDGCKASIYARAAEHAHKLALIHHVSKLAGNCLSRQVEEDSVSWATKTAEHLVEHLIESTEDNVAANEWHALEQRVIRAIKGHSTEERPGLSSRDLKKFIPIPNARFDELLKWMLDKGSVFSMDYAGFRGPKTKIFCVPADGKRSVL